MICSSCKKFFLSGTRADGIPNGAKLVLKGKKSVTLCADCLINLGVRDSEKQSFLDSVAGKAEGGTVS